MDVKDIKKLLDALAASDTDEFTYETGDFKIHVKRAVEPVVVTRSEAAQPAAAPAAAAASPSAAPAQPAQSTPSAAEPAPAEPAADDTVEVTAPIVGTFYASPAPDAPAYVKVGDRVESGTVLCIIEAMKLMNEIEAEVAGTVAEVLVRNEEPVEYGQPLFRIEPA
jgi:acetyl-CoA carboxylase biotin carboxyl carrier protein